MLLLLGMDGLSRLARLIDDVLSLFCAIVQRTSLLLFGLGIALRLAIGLILPVTRRWRRAAARRLTSADAY